MATLAENAASVKAAQVAIDAAIVAKGGTTAGGLTNAAAAIAALPSGVVENDVHISLSDIIEVETYGRIETKKNIESNSCLEIFNKYYNIGSVNFSSQTLKILFKTVNYVNDGHIFGTAGSALRPHLTMYDNKWFSGVGYEVNWGSSNYDDLGKLHYLEYGYDGKIYMDGEATVEANVVTESEQILIGSRTGTANLNGSKIYLVEIASRSDDATIKRFSPFLSNGVACLKDELGGTIIQPSGSGSVNYSSEYVSKEITHVTYGPKTERVQVTIENDVPMVCDGKVIRIKTEDQNA